VIQSLWHEPVNKSIKNSDTNLPSKWNDFIVEFSKLGKGLLHGEYSTNLSHFLRREKKIKGKKMFKQLLKQKTSCLIISY